MLKCISICLDPLVFKLCTYILIVFSYPTTLQYNTCTCIIILIYVTYCILWCSYNLYMFSCGWFISYFSLQQFNIPTCIIDISLNLILTIGDLAMTHQLLLQTQHEVFVWRKKSCISALCIIFYCIVCDLLYGIG